MSISKLLIVVVVAALILAIPIISGIVASKKGRSGIGWFLLTLIFPFAILFVLIAAPVSRPSQAQPLPPSQSTEPNAGGQAYVSEPSSASTSTVTSTSNDQPSHSDQESGKEVELRKAEEMFTDGSITEDERNKLRAKILGID